MDKLKDKLLNYAVEAPDDSWDTIMHGINNTTSSNSSSRKISRYFLPIAAALVIIIFGAIFFINKRNPAMQIAKTNTNSLEKNMATFSSPDKNILAGSNDNPSKPIRENINNAKYITIANVDGNPVKISSKAASLIVSSDNQYPGRTVWNAKVNKWKARMLANPVTPTTSNFLDIADLTEALTDRNNSDN